MQTVTISQYLGRLLRGVFRSPIIWFCGPFVVSLIVLAVSADMPFYRFHAAALKVTLLYIFIPFLLVYVCLMLAASKSPRSVETVLTNVRLVPLVLSWATISAIEILNFGGLPVTEILTGGSKSYAEFGIPSLHGFANLLWLVITLVMVARRRAGDKRSTWLLMLLVVWQLLLLSRGMFIILILLLACQYLATMKSVKLRYVLGVALVGSIMVFGFGFLGRVRATGFGMAAALNVDERVPASWLWFYVYLTSPVANLANTVLLSTPRYSLFPVATLGSLVPTVVKPYLGVESGFDAYIGSPVAPFLNAGTAFRPPFLDWGVSGIVTASAAFGALAAFVRWRSRRRGVAALSFLNGMLTLNVFNNNLIAPTFLLCFFILLYWETNAMRRSYRLSARWHGRTRLGRGDASVRSRRPIAPVPKADRLTE